MNIGYNGIARMIKQAKLDKAKQSVNYGRTPGSSGSVDTQDYSSPYVPQQNSHQNFLLNSEGILSLPGSSPTTPTGSASMIPPDPSSLVSPFSKKAKEKGKAIYGDPMQRQQSLANPPVFMEDQTGDGKITQADVIKARTEGYKGSPATMHKGKPHPGEYFIAPPDASKPMKPTKQEQRNIIMEDYRGKMRQRNDSLRKLEPTDKHYLPTFDKGTDDNVNFYKDPKNKSKINALIKLSNPLRDKTQKKLRNL